MHSAGKMIRRGPLRAGAASPARGDGACGGQFTANTMACVSEAIGLALPLSPALPAPYESRDDYAVASGEAVMRLIEHEHPPARHLHPQGVRERRARRRGDRRLDQRRRCTCRPWRTSAASSSPCATSPRSCKRTPYIADLKPGGRYVAKDMGEAGGVPMLLKTLLDGGFLHGDCMTVTGKTIAENLEGRGLATPTRR